MINTRLSVGPTQHTPSMHCPHPCGFSLASAQWLARMHLMRRQTWDCSGVREILELHVLSNLEVEAATQGKGYREGARAGCAGSSLGTRGSICLGGFRCSRDGRFLLWGLRKETW